MRRLGLIFAALFALIAVVVLVRTFSLSPQPTATPSPSLPEVNAQRVAERLGQSVQFKTISYQPPQPYDVEVYEAFIGWLEETYPTIHAVLDRERINGHGLLFTWKGKDPNLRPALLTGHYDVVPVAEGTEVLWTHPPFDGVVTDTHVWGRGTLDDKISVIAILEAVDHLLRRNFVPSRTIYLAFGHDEEILGDLGAGGITDHLAEKGVELEFSLDEGSAILEGIIAGVKRPIASINVAEKGYLTLELIARAEGGHSSVPGKDTAVTILAHAITSLHANPFPARIDGIQAEMLDELAAEMPFFTRMAMANTWLFGGMVKDTLEASPETNATIRTTIAPTMLKGSPKENALPIEATATINFRVHPRDSVEKVIAHVEDAIDDDRIEIRKLSGNEPSPISSTKSKSYQLIVDAVKDVYGDVVVAPGLTIGGTDSKHYATIARDAYRFLPIIISPEALASIHGTNEHVSIESAQKATQFFILLMQEL